MITENEAKHIEWIYYRMIFAHGENPEVDYMIKFREILDKLGSKKVERGAGDLNQKDKIERGSSDDYPIIDLNK